ncbi:saccharopine dehydrogenase NADP-binding domain-containing protein [Phenylobacterium sp.]|uniref:saccharopine dehydrogenase family protein n=1 Tax=Phenylobacterium sp. TaxID=1871053 RepID=UPI0011F97742|nr:saccharopine dehydrogenase NADP-binding domain-containing protein [Phenylobacterium sp.]THD64761.1 MAG: saccharopine dehydrogenase [Phenylobacterium sp.]
MNPNAEFDLIVYGATGYTGRLVAEYLGQRYGVGGEVSWAMAGRSQAKLEQVRDELGLPAETPLVVADADDPASLEAMVRRAKAVVTTVGPYQLYGEPLVAACVAAGADCLDLCGEPNWMAEIVRRYDAPAKASGARIVHSCGFDSIPFELGVFFAEETAKAKLGAYVPRVKGRLRAMQGGLSGGTAASGAATMAAIQKDPSLMALMMNPFALTPGFQGPPQPPGNAVEHDEDLGAEVGPFMMAAINTKNVHRSNALMGHPWGTDFAYDEMAVVMPGAPAAFDMGAGAPKPGEGPSKAEREAGFFDVVFVGVAPDGRKVKVSVKGDRDPGYGSTSKMLAEAAICLVRDAKAAPGGVWTPGAAMGSKLIERLEANAGLTFAVEG